MSTIKQRNAVKKVVENGGNVSQAMIAAGYKPATAKTPQKLTESKAWPELMDEYLPDDKVLQVHANGLEAVKIFSSHTEPDREVVDHPTRLKAVEMAYKVKGKLLETAVQVQVNVQPILGELKAQ